MSDDAHKTTRESSGAGITTETSMGVNGGLPEGGTAQEGGGGTRHQANEIAGAVDADGLPAEVDPDIPVSLDDDLDEDEEDEDEEDPD